MCDSYILYDSVCAVCDSVCAVCDSVHAGPPESSHKLNAKQLWPRSASS